MHPVPKRWKRCTIAKPEKTCNQWQAKKHMHPIPLPSAEKDATGASAGKHATSDKRGKTSSEHLIGQEGNKFSQIRYDLEYCMRMKEKYSTDFDFSILT